jgi:predicted transport protein
MPLFGISDGSLSSIAQLDFSSEKALQTLIEANLEVVFNSRLVASQFPTGPQHGGRIDTLAISEDNSPVIIEYKKSASSELINQSLFYLSWINDHRGDFEIAVQKAVKKKIEVDWSHVRVICIAPNYKKYDLYAVQVMGADIELWTYRFYKQFIYLEEVLQKTYTTSTTESSADKNPIMVAAGKKAAATRATGQYSFEEHLSGQPEKIQDLAKAIQEFILGLDPAIEEVPKKLYVAYRSSQNIVCMELHRQKLILFLKLNPKEIGGPAGISRDVTNIGHFGTGDLEVTIKNVADFETAKPFIEKAYQRVGG